MGPGSSLLRSTVALLLLAACSCTTLMWRTSEPLSYKTGRCFWTKTGSLKVKEDDLDPKTNYQLSIKVNEMLLCSMDLRSCRATFGVHDCSCTTETENGKVVARFKVQTRPRARHSGGKLTARLEAISPAKVKMLVSKDLDNLPEAGETRKLLYRTELDTLPRMPESGETLKMLVNTELETLPEAGESRKLVDSTELGTLPRMTKSVDLSPKCFFRNASTWMLDQGFLRMTHPAGEMSTLECCVDGAIAPVVTKATFNGKRYESHDQCVVAEVKDEASNTNLRFKYRELAGCRRFGDVEYVVIPAVSRFRREAKSKKDTTTDAQEERERKMESMKMKEAAVLFLLCGLIAAGGIGAIIYMACTCRIGRKKSRDVMVDYPDEGMADHEEAVEMTDKTPSEKPSIRLSKMSMEKTASGRSVKGSKVGSTTDQSPGFFAWLYSKIFRTAPVQEEKVEEKTEPNL